MYVAGWAIVAAWMVYRATQLSDPSWLEWIVPLDIDASLIYAGWLILAPFFWRCRSHTLLPHEPGLRWLWIFSLLPALAALGMNAWTGSWFLDAPPAYHDEYSYLVQADTFLAGRVSYPSPPLAHLFDQMHVLNEGRFASRYFPGVGLWLAPFVAIGHPYWSCWLAGALIAWCVYWIGCELGGFRAGLLAGMLTACAPGMELFGNLLLAHHPTLLGLSAFMLCYYRWRRLRRWGWAFGAGSALAYAMLCRPMTAAGIGLPFGIDAFVWLAAGRPLPMVRRCGQIVALGIPVFAGFAALAAYDQAITGNWRVTPYQLYTDIYTPRHVYGFANRERGEQALGGRDLPLVSRGYDEWAKNLTPELAAENTGLRLLWSWRWTLGVLPLALGMMAWACAGLFTRRGWWLIPTAILSLFVVHIPYWFVGIMHWHYVFESGPLWLLLFAGGSAWLWENWGAAGRRLLSGWWALLIGAAVLLGHASCEPFWVAPRDVGLQELSFARGRYYKFRQFVAGNVRERPALVLVEPDPADVSMDFVTNKPTFDAPVLIGRYDPRGPSRAEIAQAFPGRAIYLFRAKTGDWELLRSNR
ncbi:MAG TPA: hypothetical protein VHB77_19975 [Planctomycetaceae bacterium]|nr:hypothetical protein [Planctomycetaceae bacterium]